jgi:hypothetical protein
MRVGFRFSPPIGFGFTIQKDKVSALCLLSAVQAAFGFTT